MSKKKKNLKIFYWSGLPGTHHVAGVLQRCHRWRLSSSHLRIRPQNATSSFSKDMVRRWNFQGCFQIFTAALIHSLLCKIRGRHETASWCIRPHDQKKKEGLQAGIKKQMWILNVNLYFSEINNNIIEKGTRITS